MDGTIPADAGRLGLQPDLKTSNFQMQKWHFDKQKIGELKEDELETISELLGHREDGTVMKVHHKPSGIVMVRKLLRLEANHISQKEINVTNELKILQSCNSPYIIGFYGSIYSDEKLSLFMEYMDGLSLDIISKKIGPIPEPILGKISNSVLSGLQYLENDLKILHRDLEPSNILINSQGEIKLCNFCITNESTNWFIKIHNQACMKSYMAPERLAGDLYDGKSDVWSFGLSLVELAIGKYPIPVPTIEEYSKMFNKPLDELLMSNEKSMSDAKEAGAPLTLDTLFELLTYIYHEPPPTLPRGIWSNEFVDFIGQCLEKDLQRRANLENLLVTHPDCPRTTHRQLDFHPFQAHPFVEMAMKQETDISDWVQEMIRNEHPMNE